jgi:chorismate-pyruvate lyase
LNVESELPTRPELDSLIAIFYAQPERLGQFRTVRAEQIPVPYRDLLAHNHHMTVTVEAFHASPVDVEVLSVAREQGKYCRRIVLRRTSDQAVVQFGIVRLTLGLLEQSVREQIEQAQTPLGRVLIENCVMRDVELHGLYQVDCGPDLAQLFDAPERTRTFGRTALIYCNGDPAVELLEIVAPVPLTGGN